MDYKITLLEALTGTNFTIKHLDGTNIKVLVFKFRLQLYQMK